MFRNLTRERAIIDKEMELYAQEKKLAIYEDLEASRLLRHTNIEALALKCADDTAKYEHTYHSTMEKLGIDIAKLEAKKEGLEEMIAAKKEVLATDKIAYEKIISHKDSQIKSLNEMVLKLIEKQQPVQVMYPPTAPRN